MFSYLGTYLPTFSFTFSKSNIRYFETLTGVSFVMFLFSGTSLGWMIFSGSGLSRMA